jgi:ATP-binding cassette subfamily F protein 3
LGRYKKTKAKQAQAKLTQIRRLGQERRRSAAELDALTKTSRTLGFEFLNPPRSGRTVVTVEDLDVSAGKRLLLADVSFAIERGEHVGLVGPNGSGKTTLLELLLTRPFGYGVVPAYFSQQGTELDERGSVLDCAQRATGLQRPQAQKLLGRFLFSGWEMHERPVIALSGGERRRLSLALVVASGANFLILDEPTNHLDLESREALEAALEAFPGTVLLVSHDRALLDAVARRTLAIEDEPCAVRRRLGRLRAVTSERDLPRGIRPPPYRKVSRSPAPAPAPAKQPQALVQVEAGSRTRVSRWPAERRPWRATAPDGRAGRRAREDSAARAAGKRLSSRPPVSPYSKPAALDPRSKVHSRPSL